MRLKFILLTILFFSIQSHAQTITTIAGDGKTPMAQLEGRLRARWTLDICVDVDGNLFIADHGHHRVQKVAPSGEITTVAGTGTRGYSGDGGPATEAQLDLPSGVAVDGQGNLFIADFGNGRVRKVDTSGKITTVAGTGSEGYSGDGGPATQAQFKKLQNVSVDASGDLFIVDAGNHCIRKVDASGRITTVVGTGAVGYSGDGGPATQAQINAPNSVAVDDHGNLFIAEFRNGCVRKVDVLGKISTVAGTGTSGYSGDGGPAIEAQLNRPNGIALDRSGNLYISDIRNNRVRKVDISGVITTVAGTGSQGYSGDGGSATEAQINRPMDIFVDAEGVLFIATRSNVVRKVDRNGIITTVAGHGALRYAGDGGPATSAQLGDRVDFGDVAVDGLGNLYITDDLDHSVRKVDASGIIRTIVGTGFPGYSGDGGPATKAQLRNPLGVFVDGLGNVFIGDTGNHRVRKVDTSGIITTIAGNGTTGDGGDGGAATQAQLNHPIGVFADGVGNLFIADDGSHRICKIDPSGTITTVAGTGLAGYGGDGGPAAQAQLNRPIDVFGDGAGNLFVAEFRNHRIRKVDARGVITTVAGNGKRGFSEDGISATSASLRNPAGVFVDDSNHIFIAEAGGHRVRKVDAFGVITTVAGDSTRGYRGDGGPATQAQLNRPTAVVGDASGNLYIRDLKNHRVRKVSGYNGAYVIRQYQTDRCLFEDDGSYHVRELRDLKPEHLRFVWNVTDRDGFVSIQNADSRGFLRVGMAGLKDTRTDGFFLKESQDGAVFIVPNLDDDAKRLIAGDDGELRVSENYTDAGKWELVRVGAVQRVLLNTVEETRFDEHPQLLDGRQVLVGVDGYIYGSEDSREYHPGFRWLCAYDGWIKAFDGLIAYRENEVFTLEYVGTWENVLKEQNEYAQQCKVLQMPEHVFVLKSRDGAYVQAEGVTTQLNYNTGLPEFAVVHLSVGKLAGIHPDYPAGTSERDKAALFGVSTKRYENEKWIDDGRLRLHAISHQWNQPPSLFAELMNQKPSMPIWGIVTPISLYTLQALHNLHHEQPWPTDYEPPEDHWLTAYPLGAVISDGVDTAKMGFVNTVQKERLYNPLFGTTTGWKYWFHAYPGTGLRLFVLERSERDGDS